MLGLIKFRLHLISHHIYIVLIIPAEWVSQGPCWSRSCPICWKHIYGIHQQEYVYDIQDEIQN